MTALHKNRVQMSVDSVGADPYTITLNAASSGYQSFATAYGANATVDILITMGTTWEVARNCTYTHVGTTVTRGTLEASSTGSRITTFDNTAVVSVIFTAGKGNLVESALLDHVAGTDADTTMTVGSLYVVDMSAWATADRTYTLPATAVAGDRVGIMVTAGDATHELLITAASGDTLNAISGGTEWSRVFITGEVVIMRCVAANATWIVEQDGRIPQAGLLRLTTAPSANEAVATFVYATAATPTAGVWTVDVNVGSCCAASEDKIVARRAGNYSISSSAISSSSVTDQKYFGSAIEKNNTTVAFGNTMRNPVAVALRAFTTGSTAYPLAAGDYVRFKYRSEEGSKGLSAGAAGVYDTYLSMSEEL